MGVGAFEVALILAALGEYGVAHPELVGQVDQVEAAVLAAWTADEGRP